MKFLRQKLKSLYDWTIRAGQGEYAVWFLCAISFFGSTIFPLPTEIIMIPMMFARPRRSFHIATIALITSVLGGISGYYLGWAMTPIGEKILNLFHYSLSDFTAVYDKWGWWFVFAGGLTPFPYKIICVASGMIHLNLPVFIAASLVSRAVRYYLIAWGIFAFGERARRFIEKHLEAACVLLFVLLILFAWAMTA